MIYRLCPLIPRILLVAIACLASVPTSAQAQEKKTAQIDVRQIADIDPIQPGKTFRLAVYFRMQPDWHIYYKEPGEAGLPTLIKWTLPAGFTVGELQYPTPKNFVDSNIRTRGYDGEAIFYSEIKAPANLTANQSITASIDASWLVCKADGQCIPGNLKANFTLNAGTAANAQSTALLARLFPAALVPNSSSTEATAPGSTPAAPTATPAPADATAPAARPSATTSGAAVPTPTPLPEGKNIAASLIADVQAIEPGKPFRLGARFVLRPDYHIYFRTPGEAGLPTKVDWRLPPDFEVGPLQWAAPHDFNDSNIRTKGYSDEIVLFSWVTPSASLGNDGPFRMQAKLEWLVCNAGGQCVPGGEMATVLLPMGKALPSQYAARIDKYSAQVPEAERSTAPGPKSISIKVTSDSGASTGAGETKNASATVEPGDSNDAVETAEAVKLADAPPFSFLTSANRPAERSFAVMLLFAFIGGMILNVMPCVLPVLSIKILSFVRQANEDPKRVFQLGLVFALGVMVSFAVLATAVVLLKVIFGKTLGWGFLLSSPTFIIVLSAVIFAFGLSLLGVFSIELPGSALQSTAGLQQKEGPAGAFFNGVLATVLATPCTAPLLGPALGYAFVRPPAFIYLFFFLIAAGLSAPYVLLSANPRWLRFVPKPGAWMNVFKELMGFLLMGSVVWLLSILAGNGARLVVWTVAFLGAVGLGCWLWDKAFDLRASAGRRWGIASLAIATVVAGFFVFPQRELNAIATAEPAVGVATGIWQPFSVTAVEREAGNAKTVFIDFTADWCLTCKVNEGGALASDSVLAAFSSGDVSTFRADYTDQPEDMTRILNWFGRAGVPMYVIFPAGRPQDYVVLPEALTPSIVVKAIREAAERDQQAAALGDLGGPAI